MGGLGIEINIDHKYRGKWIPPLHVQYSFKSTLSILNLCFFFSFERLNVVACGQRD